MSARNSERVSARNSECVSARNSECVSARNSERVSARNSECVSARNSECVSARNSECVSARMGERVSARMGERVSARMGECVSARMGERVSARMGECVSARMGECVSAWMGECTDAGRWRRTIRLALLFGFACGLAPPAESASPEESAMAAWSLGLDRSQAPIEVGTVVAVLDGGHLRLDDERVLVLAALQVPQETTAEARLLRKRLTDLVLDRAIAFDPQTATIDRYGRIEALAAGPDDRWLQLDLLERGLARVRIGPQPLSLLEALLDAEDKARRAAAGLWANAKNRPLAATRVETGFGRFQIVEGRVLDSAVVRGRSYLNFGEDWRSDFTAVIPPRERRHFTAAGRAAEDLAGRRIRVRGWLGRFNGPMIELRYPGQIEILPD